MNASAEAPQNDHINHARELLGKKYRKIVLDRVEMVEEFDSWVEATVERSFQNKYKKHSHAVAVALIDESRKHKFDPVFLMAVIQNESSFDPTVRGTSGEIGLMQILPNTAKWMAKKIGMKWEGEKTLLDPAKNVRIGAAYLAMLRERFDSRGGLYLAAYNMGVKNVNRALSRDVHPKDYAIRVMHRYIQFYGQIPASPNRGGRMLASVAH